MRSLVLVAALALAGGLAGVSQLSAAAQVTPDAAVQALEAGRAAMQRKDWSAALEQFGRAAANDKLAPAARFYVGLVHEQTGRQAKAVAEYKAVSEMRGLPGDVLSAAFDRLSGIGFERLQKGDPAGAEDALRPLTRGSRFDALHYYALAVGQQQKWSELEKTAQQILRIDPYGAEAWRFLFEAQKRMAAAAAADPARAAEAAKLEAALKATAEAANALPFMLGGLEMAQENGTHVVKATIIGNAAPAGSWCIIDFSLDMAGKRWRAHTMVTAPAKGQQIAISAPALGSKRNPAPAATERVYNVTYPRSYCETPGAAAATPPGAAKASLDGCPETAADARALVRNRQEIGSLRIDGEGTDYSYPAGGISLFGKPINRLTVSGDLYRFGLPGNHAASIAPFRRAYSGKLGQCFDGYCSAGVSDSYTKGVLTVATLVAPDWPERVLPRQTYLQCLYR